LSRLTVEEESCAFNEISSMGILIHHFILKMEYNNIPVMM
jgi:hypothetical protein